MTAEFKFGPWLPDQIDYKSGALEDCRNAIPSASGYRPARKAAGTGLFLDEGIIELEVGTGVGTILLETGVDGIGLEPSSFERIVGVESFYKADGSAVIAICTEFDLVTVVGETITRTVIGFGPLVAGDVDFAQFGTSIYVTIKDVNTYYLPDIEVDLSFSVSGGTPPSAVAIARVADFLVMGNLKDVDASDAPYRLRWSKFNDPQGLWETDIATQSGFFDMPKDQGDITAVSGGTFGFVFQRRGISRLTYTGGGSVFALELFEKNRGCPSPRSIVRVGDKVYFISFDGFFVTDGSTVTSVSQGRLWRWLKERVDPEKIPTIPGAADLDNRCIVWSIPRDAILPGFGLELPGSDNFTLQLYYSWETGEWSYTVRAVDWLFTSTRKSFDPGLPARGQVLAAFVDSELSFLEGAPLEATFEGSSMQPSPGNRTFVRGVTPLLENQSKDTQISIGTRNDMVPTVDFTTPVAIGSLGFAPLASDGRYHRVKVIVPEDSEWSDAYGYQIDSDVSGEH